MDLSNRVRAVKGLAQRGAAGSAEDARSVHWLDPVQTGLVVDCGGCGAGRWVMNVASPRSEAARRELALPDLDPSSQIIDLESSVR